MTEFDKACLAAAAEFLQTVVLLDDRAAFDKDDSQVLDNLEEPEEAGSAPARTQESRKKALTRMKAEDLDAGVIISGFAARGFVCAVLRPDKGGSDDITLKAAERADVVVLDWEMGDKGAKATEIIRRLHQRDHGHGDRLRLVVIYTGANPLRAVADHLESNLTGFKTPAGVPATDLVFENAAGTTRLSVLAKTAVYNAPEEAHLAVSDKDLPGRIITEFAHFAGGLLPNATLASIAALRSHTHKVLSRLDKKLDGPLLTHRTLVDSADAEQFVATLIMEELASQVPLAGISRTFFGEESIRAYFDHRSTKRLKSDFVDGNGKRKPMTIDETCALIEKGVKTLPDQIIGFANGTKDKRKDVEVSIEKNLYKRLYHLTENKKLASEREHERLAVISGMARESATDIVNQIGGAPVLKLGTVLEGAGSFWVCMTPLCDCVRIPPEGGRFLLLEMSKVTKGGDPWSVIVEVDGSHVRLLIEKKRPNLVTVSFKPSTGDVVRATIQDREAASASRPPDGVDEGHTKVEEAMQVEGSIVEGASPESKDDKAADAPSEAGAMTTADGINASLEPGTVSRPDAPVDAPEPMAADAPAKPMIAVFVEASPPDGRAGVTYRWLGEMKAMQAQRVVQNFASNVSRVGLDEFDWQRRQAPPA